MDSFQLRWRYSWIYRNREKIYGRIVIISGILVASGLIIWAVGE